MANKTTNFGLTKPLAEEFYDVNVQNENMDIIDDALAHLNVNFSGTSEDDYAIDKTFAEIKAAYEGGKRIQLIEKSGKNTYIYSLVHLYTNDAVFVNVRGEYITVIIADAFGYIARNQYNFLFSDHEDDVNAHGDIRVTANNAYAMASNAIEGVSNKAPLNHYHSTLKLGSKTYDGTDAVDLTDQVTALINEQLGVIENGTY